MRIGGLASGMDTEQIIKDLMKAERMPLNKLNQKKQYLEWQRDDYREMNKTLLDFSTMMFDGIMKEGNYIHKSIIVSNSEFVSIKNINSTSDFQGKIKVNTLAESAVITSSAEKKIDPEKKLAESLGLNGGQSIKIKAINKEGKLEEKEIKFDPSQESLNSLMKKINEQTGVTMLYDAGSGKASVMAKNSGATVDGKEIILEGNEGNVFSLLNIAADNTGVGGKRGVNAQFNLNGLEMTRSSNTFNINGVEYTLKALGESTYSSSTDVDKVFDNIKSFVDKYNEVIGKINGEVNEKRYRSYQPLTQEEREALSDKEVELWDEKAKSGTLRGDSVLTSALNKMRMDLYSSVSGGNLNQLTEIGITTSKNYLDRGKLIIDEDKLKEAIANDSNAVYKLFAADGTKENEKGIARKLRKTITDTIASIEEKAGKSYSVNNTFSLGKTLDSLENQISRFESKMIQVEDRYWRQFTAMEKAIQQANSQSAYLMNQFG